MSTLKTINGPQNHVRLGCHDCRKCHDVVIPCDDPTRLLRELESWSYKHAGHRMPFPHFQKREMPRDFDDAKFDTMGRGPWWHPASGFKENANFTTSYVAAAALTVTSWATLASNTDLLTGASSLAVDLGATGAPLEVGVTARIKNGTTPTTAKEIDLYAYAAVDDVPTYPDILDGTDAAKVLTSTDAANNAVALMAAFASTTTTGSTYPTGWHTLKPTALSAMFGVLPRYWGLFLCHNTVAAFASGSVAHYKGLYVAS